MANLQWTNPRPLWWEAGGQGGRQYIIQGADNTVMYLSTYNPTAPTDSLRHQIQTFKGASATLEQLKALAEKRESLFVKPETNFDNLMRVFASPTIEL